MAETDVHAAPFAEAPTPDPAQDVAREVARFRSLVEATAALVWRTDAEGRALDLGRWNTLFGQTAEESAGHGWSAVLHPDELPRKLDEWRAALHDRRPFTAVCRLRLADGRYRRFRTRGVPIFGEDGSVAEWVGVLSDVEDRAAAQEALLASEARYRALVQATSQIVWRTDAEGREAEGHEAWSAFTGVPVTPESPPADWFIPVHPDDRAALTAAWRAGLAAGVAYEQPYRARAADGSWRQMVVHAVPVRGADGAIYEWVGTHTDVSEREATRAALERERALLAESQRIGQLGSWEWDLTTGATWVSDEVYRIFGVPPEAVSMLGHNAVAAFDALLTPGDRVRSDAQRRSVMAARLPTSSGRWRAVRPDGRPIVVVTRSEWRYDDAGRPVYASGTVQDVTDQVAADEALRASEERFRLAAQATHDVLYEWDVEGEGGWVSDSLHTLYGAPDDVPPTRTWWESRMHADDRARVLAALTAALAGTDETWTAEYRLRRGDGTWATVLDRAYIVRDEDGHARRRIGAVLDVSAQRELEAQFRQAQKMEAVGQLAGGVAHDFNNLLSVILASAELSRGAAAPGSVLAADLEEIVRAAHRGARLTRQLLAFSRRQVLRPRLVDLAGVVRGAEALLRRLLPETVALDLALPDTAAGERSVYVHADPGQLEQVLMNLVVNARDAVTAPTAPENRRIERTVGLVQVAVDAVYLDALPDGGDGGPDTAGWRPGVYARLRVRDDGVGMDAATRARVFEPFFTTKSPGQGTGLGLSTAYGIAAQSGGTMHVESAPGRGATFTVLLPAAGDGAVAGTPAAGPGDDLAAAPTAVAATVLLVEDEAAVRRIARRVLERAGYRVLEARHGADALLVWDEHGGAIDAVITDLRMPELGGHDLIARLRARRPTLPVVLMSGYVREPGGVTTTTAAPDAPAARPPGPPVRGIDKPFAAEDLVEAVRDVLGGNGAAE